MAAPSEAVPRGGWWTVFADPDLDRLEAALDEAVARHADRYAPVQRELFAYSFDLTDRPSSERAAAALCEMLDAGAARG